MNAAASKGLVVGLFLGASFSAAYAEEGKFLPYEVERASVTDYEYSVEATTEAPSEASESREAAPAGALGRPAPAEPETKSKAKQDSPKTGDKPKPTKD